MLRISRLINRWSPATTFLLVGIKVLQFLRKIGLKPQEDGWRRATRVFLRTEESKFVLASFRLKIPIDWESEATSDPKYKEKYIVDKISRFLRGRSECHWRLQWGRFSVRRVPHETVDAVFACFDERGYLRYIDPYFDREAHGALLSDIDQASINIL
ncbi:hypothetical protein ACFL2W_01140, partial [Candidatus Omnitrophota bacterium]